MFKTLKDIDVKNKRVLVRCDFNVPLDEKGNITDDFRIKQALPTIEYLIKNKAKIILMSHLGEPGGKIVENLKMDKVQEKLTELLDLSVIKAPDCVGLKIEEETKNLENGEILLLENLRFHKEETENLSRQERDPAVAGEFARELSKLGDIYINEAFSVCHRNHASIALVPTFLPSAAGFLLEKEIEVLDKVMGKSLPAGRQAAKPMIAVIGGKKVGTKVKIINKISEVADFVLISGLIKKEELEKNIKFSQPKKIIGPAENLGAKDIDEKTIKLFEEKIKTAKTVLWNGPFGKTEDKEYEKGTLAIAKAIIKSKAFSVAGGGETMEFLNRKGLVSKFSYVSTGGGAMMEYLSGEKLPGLEALN